MADKAPAFQFYAKDWLVDTAHLTPAQEGVYVRLLAHEWVEGPGLPADMAGLARRARMGLKEFRAIWKVIRVFFPPTGRRVANPRIEKVRKAQAEHAEKRRLAGKAGAEARWPEKPMANAPQSHSDRNAIDQAKAMLGNGSASSSASPSERQKQFARANEKTELPGSDRRRSEGQGMAHIGAPLEAIAARLANAKPAA